MPEHGEGPAPVRGAARGRDDDERHREVDGRAAVGRQGRRLEDPALRRQVPRRPVPANPDAAHGVPRQRVEGERPRPGTRPAPTVALGAAGTARRRAHRRADVPAESPRRSRLARGNHARPPASGAVMSAGRRRPPVQRVPGPPQKRRHAPGGEDGRRPRPGRGGCPRRSSAPRSRRKPTRWSRAAGGPSPERRNSREARRRLDGPPRRVAKLARDHEAVARLRLEQGLGARVEREGVGISKTRRSTPVISAGPATRRMRRKDAPRFPRSPRSIMPVKRRARRA